MKKVYFLNISKTAHILIKKQLFEIIYKKTLYSEHQKMIFFWDINFFLKMSVNTLSNFVYALAQKLVWISKRNFTPLNACAKLQPISYNRSVLTKELINCTSIPKISSWNNIWVNSHLILDFLSYHLVWVEKINIKLSSRPW